VAAPKTERLHLRVGSQDSELFRRAASAQDESLTDFLVESGRERAERILADRKRFALDDQAWASFTAALDRPAEVRPAVVELLTRPRPE
jgi:uncharacterized protein (DUF1778 family)